MRLSTRPWWVSKFIMGREWVVTSNLTYAVDMNDMDDINHDGVIVMGGGSDNVGPGE